MSDKSFVFFFFKIIILFSFWFFSLWLYPSRSEDVNAGQKHCCFDWPRIQRFCIVVHLWKRCLNFWLHPPLFIHLVKHSFNPRLAACTLHNTNWRAYYYYYCAGSCICGIIIVLLLFVMCPKVNCWSNLLSLHAL